MTLNQLVYDIKNIISGGTQSDDIRISDRQVTFWINQARATLIGQLLSDGKSIPDALIQHLECVELECVDAAECCEISTCAKVLKSVQKIPETIGRNNRNTILSVSSPDKTVGFTETTYFRQRTNRHNKYTGNKPRWFTKNNYLYVTNEKVLEYVSLSGIFEDPTEALLFTDCDKNPCFTWDSEYPITSRIASVVTSMILKERIGIMASTPNDQTNNANGNIENGQASQAQG